MDKREELLTKAKPILFNTEMVRAILDGRKTVTRRVLKNQDLDRVFNFDYVLNKNGVICGADLYCDNGNNGCWILENKAPYFEGDILYVRETWCKGSLNYGIEQYYYKADDKIAHCRWEPSSRMPKEAARIFLKVTNVRVEKLQDIIPNGCLGPYNIHKEGLRKPCILCIHPDFDCSEYIKNTKCDLFNEYIELWDCTIKKKDLGKYGWDANPWVWVVEFERVK